MTYVADTNEYGTYLITTKLHVPRMRVRFVSRPRLLQRMKQVQEHTLTLLCAPAGSGKTTLLTEWATATSLKIAWISLDKEDNDATRFWTYVSAAIDMCVPNFSSSIFTALHTLSSTPTASYDSFVAPFVNALRAISHEMTLVLDDYHLIETPSIHYTLAKLLEYLPAHIHIVIATRTEPSLPLARLRVYGQLLTLSLSDLSFQEEETAQFLRNTMGLTLEQEDIGHLEERTEGWVAGLQLAALSVQHQKEPSRFITTFTGNHRYMLDYLTNEVLQQQSEDIQMFLLQTSILNCFAAALCNAVTERVDSLTVIEYLYRANIFTTALDAEGCWYRYHPLFAEFLRNRLQTLHAQLIPLLHRRASQWYIAQSMYVEAIIHAFATDDYEYASLIVEQNLETMWLRGEFHILQTWLHTLSSSHFSKRPRLALYQALVWCRTHHERAEIEHLLQDVDNALVANECDNPCLTPEYKRLVQGERCVVNSMLAVAVGKYESILEHCHRAIALLAKDSFWQGFIRYNIGLAHFFLGEDEAASHFCTESIVASDAINDLYTLLQAQSILTSSIHRAGHLHKVVTEAKQTLQRVPQGHISASIHAVILSSVYYEWHQLDFARRYAEVCIEYGKQAGNSHIIWQGNLHLTRVQYADGEKEQALARFPQLDQMVRGAARERVMVSNVSFQTPMWLEQGYEDVVLRLIDEYFPSQWNERTLSYLSIVETWTRLYLYQNKPDKALEILLPALQYVTKRHWTLYAVEMLVLKGVALAMLEDITQAIRTMIHVLTVAKVEGYVRAFLNGGEAIQHLLVQVLADTRAESQAVASYAQQLLLVMGVVSPQCSTASSVLSRREQDVLRLLATGCSDKEIAQRLVIGQSTVASHLKRIYVKLDAHSRTQAIRNAKALNML